jgi:predicted nucleic acid-binding protein
MPANSEKRVIISDTSCLIGLTNIGLLDVLRRLYETVIVTQEVAGEYGEALPDWISVQAVQDADKVAAYNRFIDLGESSAIALAMETHDALLILDDREARQFALSLGLKITGTVGVLLRAYQQGIITDFDSAISKLKETGFHLPANIAKLIPS